MTPQSGKNDGFKSFLSKPTNTTPTMVAVPIVITKFVEGSQPGWVQCELDDFCGQTHVFIEKIPVISSNDLHAQSPYPQPGSIHCLVISHHNLSDGTVAITIDTSVPWGIQSTEGRSLFVVAWHQLTAL
jgi:hypothetical protein